LQPCPALTPTLLKLDPVWDPLRSDPALQRLCQEPEINFTTDCADQDIIHEALTTNKTLMDTDFS
jgi:hypothetical protein